MQKHGQNSVKIIPHPLSLCSSPNDVQFRSLGAKTLCMCLLRYWREIEGDSKGREEGGGGDFQECV